MFRAFFNALSAIDTFKMNVVNRKRHEMGLRCIPQNLMTILFDQTVLALDFLLP